MSIEHLTRHHPVSVLGTLLAGSPASVAQADAEPDPEPVRTQGRLAALLASRWRAAGAVVGRTDAPSAR
jgi:hypothetical protein